MDDQWITTREAAKISNYHAEHIRRLIRTGAVKGRKFGEVWQVDRRSLSTYLQKQESKGEKRGPKA